MRRHGEGSIYRRKDDGRHQAAVSTVTGRRYLSRRKRESFEAFKARVEKAVREAKRGITGTESTKAFLLTWLESIRTSVRLKSLVSYTETVETYLIPTIGHVPLAKLTPAHVTMAMKYAENLKRAPRTIAYVRSILGMALKVAQRWGMLDRNVAALVDPPKVEKRHVEMPTEDQWHEFLTFAAGSDYEALLLLLGLLGPRRGEALGLQWSDIGESSVMFSRSLQRVKGKGLVLLPTKTSTSRRTIPLPPVVKDALDRWRVRQLEWRMNIGDLWQPSDFVFTTRWGTPVSPEKLRKIVGKRRIHDFRHIAASQLLAAGVPLEVVSSILGHSSIRVTKDVYGHIAPRVMEKAAEKMQEIGTRKRGAGKG